MAKKRKKVARKKRTKPYAGILRMFIQFLALFPRLAGENAAKHALSLHLTFQCLPNSLLELPCVFLLAETQLRHEMTFVPLKVLILPPI